MTQGSLENPSSQEKDLDYYSTLITKGEKDGLEEVIDYFINNPQNIQEIVQRVADQYPKQPFPVAITLGAVLEEMATKK